MSNIGPDNEGSRSYKFGTILSAGGHDVITAQTPPISCLPNEILANIFIQRRDDALPPERVPFILSHISHHWRVVAINTPLLWRIIPVETSHSPDVFKTYLIRSEACLIDVQLRIRKENLPLPEFHDQYSDILSQNIHRVVSLGIYDWNRSAEKVADVLRSLQSSSAPHLRRLEASGGLYDIPTTIPILIGGAPELSHLKIETSLLFHFRPPFSALRNLWIFRYGKQLSWEMFRAMICSTRLERLIIEKNVVSLSDKDTIEPFMVPSLKSLEIEKLESPTFMRICEAFYAAPIRYLHFGNAGNRDLEFFVQSCKRHGNSPKFPQLESLTLNSFLRRIGPMSTQTIDCLNIFNNIQRLTINLAYLPLLFVPALFPHLQAINLNRLKIIDADLENQLRQMISLRIDTEYPIEILRLSFDDRDYDPSSPCTQWLSMRVKLEILHVPWIEPIA